MFHEVSPWRWFTIQEYQNQILEFQLCTFLKTYLREYCGTYDQYTPKFKLIVFWSGQRDDWFNPFAQVSFVFFGNLFLDFHHLFCKSRKFCNLWRSNIAISFAKDKPTLDFIIENLT